MSKIHKNISKSMIRAIQAGIIAGSLGAFLPLAMALPGGGVSSTASIDVAGTNMSITGSAANNVIAWGNASGVLRHGPCEFGCGRPIRWSDS